MRGYTGHGDLFHRDIGCASLHGSITELPETKALKWDIAYCPDCFAEYY